MAVGDLHQSAPRLNVRWRNNNGLPVLFQHGLGGDANQVSRICPSDTRFDFATVECAGHGRSSCPQPPSSSLEAFYSDIEAFCAGAFPSGFAAGGISMGAALALALAIRKPAEVRALVLVRPAWVFGKAPINLEPIRIVGELLQRHSRTQALELFAGSSLAREIRESSPDNYDTLIDDFDERQPHWLGKLLTDIAVDGFDFSLAQLRGIGVPTLVIGVEADLIHPMALAKELHTGIPGSRFEVAPRKDDVCADPSYYRRTAELIAEFLCEIERRAGSMKPRRK